MSKGDSTLWGGHRPIFQKRKVGEAGLGQNEEATPGRSVVYGVPARALALPCWPVFEVTRFWRLAEPALPVQAPPRAGEANSEGPLGQLMAERVGSPSQEGFLRKGSLPGQFGKADYTKFSRFIFKIFRALTQRPCLL